MWNNICWNHVQHDSTISLIEHPIYPCLIEKEEYSKEFKPVLELLNGETMSDYMDFFFSKDKVLNNSLKFIGEDERMDFYEMAVELECLPKLKELHHGESDEDKQKRIRLENNLKSQEIQKQKTNKKQFSLYEKEIKKLLGCLENIKKKEINQTINSEDKLRRSKEYLKENYKEFKSEFCKEIEPIENYFNLCQQIL